jgi:hypothetical protein
MRNEVMRGKQRDCLDVIRVLAAVSEPVEVLQFGRVVICELTATGAESWERWGRLGWFLGLAIRSAHNHLPRTCTRVTRIEREVLNVPEGEVGRCQTNLQGRRAQRTTEDECDPRNVLRG